MWHRNDVTVMLLLVLNANIKRRVRPNFNRKTSRPSVEVATIAPATSADLGIPSATEFSGGCHFFTVSNPGPLFSHGGPSRQLLSSCFLYVASMIVRYLDAV